MPKSYSRICWYRRANDVVLKDYQAQEITSFILEEFPHLDKHGNLL